MSLSVVKCKGCGRDRWWVSAEESPPLCLDCTRKAEARPDTTSKEGRDG